MLSLFKVFILALTVCLTQSAQAQWMVYDVRIQPDEEASVNFNAYTGIYLIAPIEGGPTTMVFATEKAGRVYAVSRDAGRYFVAANTQKRRGVFSSIVIDGTVHAMYQASGALNSTVSYFVRGERRATLVPLTMAGTFLASDSEITTVIPDAADIGVVGHAALKVSFRGDLTRILMDQRDQTQQHAVQTVTDLLEKYGYQPDTEPLLNTDPLSQEPAPAPAPTPPATPDGTLFPPGSKEEMEQALR
jgi:hypothetical protein